MSYRFENISQNIFSIGRTDSVFRKLEEKEIAAFDKYEAVDTTVTMKFSFALDSLLSGLVNTYNHSDTSQAFYKKYIQFTGALGDTRMNINKEVNQHFLSKEKIDFWDFTNKLSSIRVPTLILAGDHDYALPLKDFHYMTATIPEVRGVICKGNHAPFMNNPDCYFPLFSGLSRKGKPEKDSWEGIMCLSE